MKHIYFLGSCRTKFFFTRFKTFHEWPFKYTSCNLFLYTIQEIWHFLNIIHSKNYNFNILKKYHDYTSFNTFSHIVSDNLFELQNKHINNCDIVVES